jgi:hypothetical protein
MADLPNFYRICDGKDSRRFRRQQPAGSPTQAEIVATHHSLQQCISE